LQSQLFTGEKDNLIVLGGLFIFLVVYVIAFTELNYTAIIYCLLNCPHNNDLCFVVLLSLYPCSLMLCIHITLLTYAYNAMLCLVLFIK